MKKQAIIMGMPVTIFVRDLEITDNQIEEVFEYFRAVDERFSTYKQGSEVSQVNQGKLKPSEYSKQLRHILDLCEETKKQTNGYFNCMYEGKLDPSGIVKGYAIYKGAQMLDNQGFKNYFVEIAGDIQTKGTTAKNLPWRVGIENPFKREEIILSVSLSGQAIATSGTYIRGTHIYNPVDNKLADLVVSLSVIGDNIYEADRFATAAFAMGVNGLSFLESKGLCGYMVLSDKTTRITRGFEKYVI